MPENNIDNKDLQLAFDTIKAKKPLYDELYKYYAGLQPLKYSTVNLQRVFRSINAYFSENWLSVIIDAVLDRLILKGFDVSNNTAAKNKLDELWRDYDLAIIAEDVHESVTITNEGFVIAMKIDDEEGGEQTQVFYNDPRLCHVFYKADQPNEKRFAAKMWQNEEGYIRVTLYYKDEFLHFKSRAAKKPGQNVNSYKDLQPDSDTPNEDNPFDIIPVFHWQTSRTTRKRDLGPSEISMQDAINKLFADMMISSDFNSMKQRVIISRADPGNMPNESGANWWLPQPVDGNPTVVQELGGALLTGYTETIDKIATALAIISRTPKHYFFSQGGDPSGEALIALEAPLNKKVKKRQGRYTPEWKALAQFMLELENITIEKSLISPLWEPAETIQPKTLAEITEIEVRSGVPLKTSKRRQGWSDAEMKQLEDDQKDAKKTLSGLAQNELDKLRNEDAQQNDN